MATICSSVNWLFCIRVFYFGSTLTPQMVQFTAERSLSSRMKTKVSHSAEIQPFWQRDPVMRKLIMGGARNAGTSITPSTITPSTLASAVGGPAMISLRT